MEDKERSSIVFKQLKHNKVKRDYLLYVPPTYSKRNKSSVVLNFHGYGSTALGHLYYSDWRDLSNEHGFILIYPQGLALEYGGYHWNPDPPSSDNKSFSNDLGFVDKLIKKVSSKYFVDPSRIYATGFSNGAGMAYGLARHRSDLIAAVAPVSGLASTKHLSTTSGVSPVGLISFNGTDDWERPLSGIPGYLASVVDLSEYWSAINHSEHHRLETFNQGSRRPVDKTLFSRESGNVTVEQYVIQGGGHEWFDLDIGGKNLNQLAWQFLSTFRKDQGQLVIAKKLFFDILYPDSFKRKAIDEITLFNSSSHILRIEVKSFGLKHPATFASGTNKKVVKKRLARKDFDFIYDQKRGGLYFNENLSGHGFGDGGVIAVLEGAPALTAENINFI